MCGRCPGTPAARLGRPVVPAPSPLVTWLWRKPRPRGLGGRRRRPRTGRGWSAAGPWREAGGQWVAAGRSGVRAGASTEARAPAEGKNSDFPRSRLERPGPSRVTADPGGGSQRPGRSGAVGRPAPEPAPPAPRGRENGDDTAYPLCGTRHSSFI